MPKKWKKHEALTRYLYENSEHHQRNQRINELSQRFNEVNLQGDQLGNAAGFQEDQNRDAPGTETQVVKAESSSASGNLESRSNPPCPENPDEPSEDLSTNAASTSAQHSTMSITELQPHFKYNLRSTEPVFNQLYDAFYGGTSNSNQDVQLSDARLFINSPPIEGHDGSLAPENTLSSEQPSQADLGAPYNRSASQEQQSLTEQQNLVEPRTTSRHSADPDYEGIFPEGAVFSGQEYQIQPGAQRRPFRYLGQRSQDQVDSNPSSSTPYGHQGQPSQAPLRYLPPGNLELDPSQTHILVEPRTTSRHTTDHDYQGIFPEGTLFSGQQNQIQPGAQRRPNRYLGQRSQDQVDSNPRSSTSYGHQGQPSQAPLRYLPPGNLELDPSQTHILVEPRTTSRHSTDLDYQGIFPEGTAFSGQQNHIQPGAQRRLYRHLGQRSQDQVDSYPRNSTSYGHQGQPSQDPLRYLLPGNSELDPSQTHIPGEPRTTSRHSTDHGYQGIFPEGTLFSGQQNQIQPGAQRRPNRYLGQRSQDQVYSTPRSSTSYGHQGQPSQALLGYLLPENLELDYSQTDIPVEPHTISRHNTDHDYQGIFPEGTLFSGQQNQIQPGAQRRPFRYLGQRSQDQVDSNPRSSTPYQALLGQLLRENLELDYSQTDIPVEPHTISRHNTDHDYQGIFPEGTLFSGQQNQIQPGAQRRPFRYLGQRSQDQVDSNPRSSTPYGNQGQPSQAPLRYPPLGNLELDPSQTHIPDEHQQQGDFQGFPPNMSYPFRRKYC